MKWTRPIYRSLAVLVIVLMPVVGCTTNKTTGRSQLLYMSWQEEISLGSQAAPEFLEQGGGKLPDVRVMAHVARIGARLAAAAEEADSDLRGQNLVWEFHVLDSQVINAFALPGGKVFISRGLMSKMNNEAQLAGVLGHEVGHVSGRHGNERVTKALGVQVIAGVIAAGAELADSDIGRVFGVGAATGGGLYLLKYSRENELEADALGVRYMAQVGYNPVGQIQVMEILGKASGGSSQPEWLSTHPLSQTRIDQLTGIITNKYPRYSEDGYYEWGFESFKQNIAIPLSKLPPAKHGQSAFLDKAEFEKIAGISWEQALHRGCACHAK